MRGLGVAVALLGAAALTACATLPGDEASPDTGIGNAVVVACESTEPMQMRFFDALVDTGLANDGRTGTLSVTALLGSSVKAQDSQFSVRLLDGREPVFERNSPIGHDSPAVFAATVPNARTDDAETYRLELTMSSADGSLSCTRRDTVTFTN